MVERGGKSRVPESVARPSPSPDELPHSHRSPRSRVFPDEFLPVAALYLLLALPLAVWQRDLIGNDGIAFIRHAMYLADGRFLDSVSSYWSPLLVWSLAPFQLLGVDGLVASRAVMTLWGLALLWASAQFANRCTSLQRPWKTLALALIALAAANWSSQRLNGDLPMAACLIGYGAFAAGSDLLRQRRSQIFAGLLGGAAFLAKAYALPFVLLHFPFSVLARAWASENARRSDTLRAGAIGLAMFALIAGPWVGVLSWKYGELTISSAGAINHAIVGPAVAPGTNPWDVHPIDRMRLPPPGRITVWEEPERLTYHWWSPFESRAHFQHQMRVIGRNTLAILGDLRRFDAFGLCVIVLVGLHLTLAWRGSRLAQFRWLWLVGTVGIFSAGYLPLWYEARYLYPFLWPICCLGFFEAWGLAAASARARSISHLRVARWTGWALTFLSILSLSLPWYSEVERGLGSLLVQGPKNYYRASASRLRRASFEGPLAATRAFQDEAICFAYHLDLPSAGVVTGSTVEEVEGELDSYRVKTFFAGARWPLLSDFAELPGWRRRGTVEAGEQKVVFFTRRRCGDAPSTPRTVPSARDEPVESPR